jgi:dinuclear metal center YbgI/SA1388 family protein
MRREELDHYTQTLLDVPRFRDACPNGLQVEGRAEVRRIVTGVSASLALLEGAVAADADAVLVHHGYFWKNEPLPIVGVKKQRIRLLLANDINLFAFHLPLDAHPELGNNAELARRLHWVVESWVGEQGLIALGRPLQSTTLGALASEIAAVLRREPLVVGEPERPVARIAWCSGGAQGWFETAAAFGIDAYVTGEISEHNVHFARESGIGFIAAGHHATERYGIQALGAHLASKFGLEHRFIDIPNPV